MSTAAVPAVLSSSAAAHDVWRVPGVPLGGYADRLPAMACIEDAVVSYRICDGVNWEVGVGEYTRAPAVKSS